MSLVLTKAPLRAEATPASTSAALDPPIELSLPVRCELGRTCFIQQYFDHGVAAPQDYRCGSRVYARHDGTDIRLPTLLDMQRGVAVVAAAAGVVQGLRDGMADGQRLADGPASVAGRECGNGVVVDHGNGWQTQYCHLKKTSVSVHVGDHLEAGAVLGQVGESGAADFAHLHITVRRRGVAVDPFAWKTRTGNCAPGQGLWSPQAANALAYRVTEVINTGLAGSSVSMKDIEDGRASMDAPSPDAPLLVAFVRAIGLKAGDVQSLELRGPAGDVLAQSIGPMLDREAAERMMLVGKRRSLAPWPVGRYTARYQIVRDGRTVVDRRFSGEVRPATR